MVLSGLLLLAAGPAFAVKVVGPDARSSSTEEFAIQPGAPAMPGHPGLGPYGVCTLNFVFVDASDTYVGTAGRCTYEVGERVSAPDIGEFGTVVYRVFSEPDDPTSFLPWFSHPDDFALIRIDPTMLVHVSPVVRGVGLAPAGFTLSNETAPGDAVLVYGQGIVLSSAEETRLRPAVLMLQQEWQYEIEVALTVGDSGAPIIHQETGKALGVISALGVPTTLGPTMERILVLLHEAGFQVSLAGSSQTSRGWVPQVTDAAGDHAVDPAGAGAVAPSPLWPAADLRAFWFSNETPYAIQANLRVADIPFMPFMSSRYDIHFTVGGEEFYAGIVGWDMMSFPVYKPTGVARSLRVEGDVFAFTIERHDLGNPQQGDVLGDLVVRSGVGPVLPEAHTVSDRAPDSGHGTPYVFTRAPGPRPGPVDAEPPVRDLEPGSAPDSDPDGPASPSLSPRPPGEVHATPAPSLGLALALLGGAAFVRGRRWPGP